MISPKSNIALTKSAIQRRSISPLPIRPAVYHRRISLNKVEIEENPVSTRLSRSAFSFDAAACARIYRIAQSSQRSSSRIHIGTYIYKVVVLFFLSRLTILNFYTRAFICSSDESLVVCRAFTGISSTFLRVISRWCFFQLLHACARRDWELWVYE